MSTPADTISTDLDAAVSSFRAGSFASGDGLMPRGWSDDDWRALFRFTSTRRVKSGDALIRRGEPDRTLYFVLKGTLEVVVHSGDGLSMGPLTRIGAGSVLGEQSFFDEKPRSASVWAVDDCDVAAMTPIQYGALQEERPALARDLLFALGRILAIRLRKTTAKVLG
jgi:CRP-like cAMP-binding protein